MSKPKPGKKMRIIRRMLGRKKGCTSAELKSALDWPSVSIPQRAKQLRVRLRRQTETRYWSY